MLTTLQCTRTAQCVWTVYACHTAVYMDSVCMPHCSVHGQCICMPHCSVHGLHSVHGQCMRATLHTDSPPRLLLMLLLLLLKPLLWMGGAVTLYVPCPLRVLTQQLLLSLCCGMLTMSWYLLRRRLPSNHRLVITVTDWRQLLLGACLLCLSRRRLIGSGV